MIIISIEKLSKLQNYKNKYPNKTTIIPYEIDENKHTTIFKVYTVKWLH